MDSLCEATRAAVLVRCDEASIKSLGCVDRTWRTAVGELRRVAAERALRASAIVEKLLGSIGACSCQQFRASIDGDALIRQLTVRELDRLVTLVNQLTPDAVAELDRYWNRPKLKPQAFPASSTGEFYAKVLLACREQLSGKTCVQKKRINAWAPLASSKPQEGEAPVMAVAASVLAARLRHQICCSKAYFSHH